MPAVTGTISGRGNQLRVTEIFHSVQGESSTAGFPTVFVRLTGCPLRCGYCDTEYAFHGGRQMLLDDIVVEVANYGARYVCVTGGEPLAQPNVLPLLARLCDAGYHVSLETSGALDIGLVDARVTIVMDIKTPGSGEASRNLPGNVAKIELGDEVKFVICSRADYEWARGQTQDLRLSDRCTVLFSPAWGQVDARELAEWILADRLAVCLQVQLHKYLWRDSRGH